MDGEVITGEVVCLQGPVDVSFRGPGRKPPRTGELRRLLLCSIGETEPPALGAVTEVAGCREVDRGRACHRGWVDARVTQAGADVDRECQRPPRIERGVV